MWLGTAADLRKISWYVSGVHVDQSIIKPVSVVGDLDVITDAELSLQKQYYSK